MAKQKATSGVAAKTAVRKKWTGLRTAAKHAARNLRDDRLRIGLPGTGSVRGSAHRLSPRFGAGPRAIGPEPTALSPAMAECRS